MKKLLLMAAVLGFTGGVNAADAEVDACEGIERFTGLYIGAGFGGSFVKQSFNAAETQNSKHLFYVNAGDNQIGGDEDLFVDNFTGADSAKLVGDGSAGAFNTENVGKLNAQLSKEFNVVNANLFYKGVDGNVPILDDTAIVRIGFQDAVKSTDRGEIVCAVPGNSQGVDIGLQVTQPGVDFSSTSNRFLGTAVFGGGKVFNKFYIGAEAMFDFTKNSSKNDCSSKDEYYRICANGFTPTVAVRLGGYVPMLKSMLYIKAGAALVRPSFESSEPTIENDNIVSYEKTTVSYSNLVPVFGLGFERAFGRKLTARLDADYRLSKSRTEQYDNRILLRKEQVYENAVMSAPVPVKFKDKGGFTVRLMLQYHV